MSFCIESSLARSGRLLHPRSRFEAGSRGNGRLIVAVELNAYPRQAVSPAIGQRRPDRVRALAGQLWWDHVMPMVGRMLTRRSARTLTSPRGMSKTRSSGATTRGAAGPEPGRPRSLGQSEDVADAKALLAVITACRSTLARGRPRSGPLRLLREAVWSIWEEPRLPRPLVASKYPVVYPWSPRARRRHKEHGVRPSGGWGLVIEHLYPRALLVDDLLDERNSSAGAIVELLAQRVLAAVLTREEDRRLTTEAWRGQMGSTWRDFRADPWLRYRHIWPSLNGFAPLVVPGMGG